MGKIVPCVTFGDAEISFLKTLQQKVDIILSNVRILQEDLEFNEAVKAIDTILVEMDNIRKNFFQPLVAEKQKLKELADRVDKINNSQ